MEFLMAYVNARQVLPQELVEAIQQHIEGQLIYIPRKADKRSAWGSKSGSRAMLHQRNQSIRQAFRHGNSMADLAASQHLSEDSIRKIIYVEIKQSELLKK
jgi:DNA-binding NarL/FixJ family response regulator